MLRMLLNLLITLVVAYVVIVLLVYFGQSRLVYFPEKQLGNTPAQSGWIIARSASLPATAKHCMAGG